MRPSCCTEPLIFTFFLRCFHTPDLGMLPEGWVVTLLRCVSVPCWGVFLGEPDKDPLFEISSGCSWQFWLLTLLSHFPGFSKVMIWLWWNHILEQILSICEFWIAGHCLSSTHLGSHGKQTVPLLIWSLS